MSQGIQVDSAMSINYGSSSWNTDSRKIDTAHLLLRDKNSGKLVKIQLEESEPDSSQFSGNFSVNWGNKDNLSPEVFIPPQESMQSEEDYKKIIQMIQENRIPRKPVVWKKNDKKKASLNVFDTREQAESALKAFQEEERIANAIKSSDTTKGPISKSALAAAAMAEQKAKLEKMALEAAQREAERVRLEQIEKQKAEERLRKAQLVSEAERAARKKQAEEIAQQAMAFYNQGDFASAETSFKKSIELDPENKNFYFQYGVTLYRNQKFNDAIVVFRLAKVDTKLEIEKKYYMGLTHYRLAELEQALQSFGEVAASQDPAMAPSARFYSGVIQFAQEKYEEAKANFEIVIDTSSDPRLDEQAEAYLDRVAAQLMYKKMSEKKWTLLGVAGLMYDSNVLLAPESAGDQGSSTNIADARLITIGDLDYRPLFNEHHEWSAKFNATLMNSAKNQAAQADPFMFSWGLPYTYKAIMGKNGFKFTAKPGYELLYMDPNGSGSKTMVLAAYTLLLDGTWVLSPKHFSSYSLETRVDDSKLANSLGDNDSDAMKYSLKTTQTFFLDKARKEALAANLGYVINIAKGKNKNYNRIEAGANYLHPAPWNSTWSLGLSIFKLEYPDADEKRDDFNLAINLGVNKPVREWMIWGLTGSYTKNDSNQTSSYEYNRWSIMTTAAFTSMF